MKFINYLESIVGIEIFPMISLMIFFTFFVVVTIKVITMDKKFVKKMVNMPFDGDKNDSSEKNK
jgi:hypothetical protein